MQCSKVQYTVKPSAPFAAGPRSDTHAGVRHATAQEQELASQLADTAISPLTAQAADLNPDRLIHRVELARSALRVGQTTRAARQLLVPPPPPPQFPAGKPILPGRPSATRLSASLFMISACSVQFGSCSHALHAECNFRFLGINCRIGYAVFGTASHRLAMQWAMGERGVFIAQLPGCLGGDKHGCRGC